MFPLFVLENKELMRKKKAESRITDDIKAREMHKKHNGPDGEHNANSYSWGSDVASDRMCCNRTKTSLMFF